MAGCLCRLQNNEKQKMASRRENSRQTSTINLSSPSDTCLAPAPRRITQRKKEVKVVDKPLVFFETVRASKKARCCLWWLQHQVMLIGYKLLTLCGLLSGQPNCDGSLGSNWVENGVCKYQIQTSIRCK